MSNSPAPAVPAPTQEEKERAQKELMVEAFSEKARRNLLDFCSFTYAGYRRPPHIRLMADKLEAVERGDIKRLMIFIPPRHGKSELASIRFPAWALGRNPNRRIIETSYGADLAQTFSRKVRDVVEDRSRFGVVFPDVMTKQDSRSVEAWDLALARGGMFAAGVGGAMTGYGADILIIDDPVKNKEEAESESHREKVWDWYRSVARTRLEPGAAIIVMMTRWHQEDLAGKILKESGEEWEVVNLPAVYKEQENLDEHGVPRPDPLGRKDGEALWPGKYDSKALAATETSSGSRVWAALYQGRPKDPKSHRIQREWIRWYDELPAGELRRGGGLDTATSKKSKADKMSLVDAVRDKDGFIYVDDVFLERVSLAAFYEYVCNQHKVKKYAKIHIESNNAGEAVKQGIEEKGKTTATYPPVEAVPTSTDKVVRVSEFEHLIENGTVRFRRGNAKVAKLVDHLVDFTGADGDEDDDVDALGFAIKAVKASPGFYLGVVKHSTDPE